MKKILIMICAAIALSASAQTEAQTTNTKKEIKHCKATKKDGTPCKMSVEKAGDRCRFHIGKEGNK